MYNIWSDFIRNITDKRIIIFGFGKYFSKFYEKHSDVMDKVDYILDNAPEDKVFIHKGRRINIIYPGGGYMDSIDVEKYVVLFCSADWRSMKEQLNGYIGERYVSFHFPFDIGSEIGSEEYYRERIIEPAFCMMEMYDTLSDACHLLGMREEELEIEMFEKNIITIPRMPIILTPRCSLRCKECNNLMWKFNSCFDLDTDKIIKSLGKIIEAVDFLPCCELIGGEPFIAKNLGEVLSWLQQQEKVLKIEITTNATLIPKEDIIPLLRNEKVAVKVSDYGEVVNQEKFIDFCSANGISVTVLDNKNSWVSPGGLDKRNRSKGDLILQYHRCGASIDCKTLWEDRLFGCARAASLAALEYPLDRADGLNVLMEKSLREKIVSFLLTPQEEACDFCDIASGKESKVPPAEQIRD